MRRMCHADIRFRAISEFRQRANCDLAKTEAGEFVEAAREDGESFLEATKTDLLIWTRQLADGVLTKDEFEFLVKGKKDVAKMEALAQAGIGAAKVEKIRTGLINAVLQKALSMI